MKCISSWEAKGLYAHSSAYAKANVAYLYIKSGAVGGLLGAKSLFLQAGVQCTGRRSGPQILWTSLETMGSFSFSTYEKRGGSPTPRLCRNDPSSWSFLAASPASHIPSPATPSV